MQDRRLRHAVMTPAATANCSCRSPRPVTATEVRLHLHHTGLKEGIILAALLSRRAPYSTTLKAHIHRPTCIASQLMSRKESSASERLPSVCWSAQSSQVQSMAHAANQEQMRRLLALSGDPMAECCLGGASAKSRNGQQIGCTPGRLAAWRSSETVIRLPLHCSFASIHRFSGKG